MPVIDISETNVPANDFVENIAALNLSQFNPPGRTMHIRVFAVANVVAAIEYSLQISGRGYGTVNAILNATPALSMRDHQILDGVALPNEKVTVTRRELGGVATTDTDARVLLEPA